MPQGSVKTCDFETRLTNLISIKHVPKWSRCVQGENIPCPRTLASAKT